MENCIILITLDFLVISNPALHTITKLSLVTQMTEFTTDFKSVLM